MKRLRLAAMLEIGDMRAMSLLKNGAVDKRKGELPRANWHHL